MKFKGFLAVVLCALLCGSAFAQSQGMDKEISFLAEKLAAQVKESGRKKVTILDFTDLQGNSSELGRFLAEELSVGLVERRTNFSVMDRANLKTILAEHKLTVDGLVEPENAKKLGQFSGVDAIILGKVTPLKDEIAITVKVITTDTAETVGAARGRIPMGKKVEHLLASAITGKTAGAEREAKPSNSATNAAPPKKKEATFHKFGDLNVEFESLRMLGKQLAYYFTKVTLVLRNENAEKSIFVAFKASSATIAGSLISDDDTTCFVYNSDISGIGVGYDARAKWTEIEPGGAIKISIDYRSKNPPRAAKSFRLQQEILATTREDWKAGQVKTHNLFLDIPSKK